MKHDLNDLGGVLSCLAALLLALIACVIAGRVDYEYRRAIVRDAIIEAEQAKHK